MSLWCADYKGEFLLGNRRYCYPLTVTDYASRYLLTCEAPLTTQEKFAFTVFGRTFQGVWAPGGDSDRYRYSVASAHALIGLRKLAVRCLRLGERITPGQPQQNGRHPQRRIEFSGAAGGPPTPRAHAAGPACAAA
jgi:putative transposase